MKFILTLLGIIFVSSFNAQAPIQTKDINPITEYDNIHVQKLSSDSLVSTFAIWVKLKVKPHKHIYHTEHVQVLEGKGEFSIADSTFSVKKGDFIIIPKNTYHSVEVTSKKPMKVISIQAPRFVGEDRVFKEMTIE